MNLNIVHWRSLKTRVTLTTLAIFLVGIWLLAFYASRMLREDMQRLLSEQQFSTASLMASVINDRLEDRLSALEIVVGKISPAVLNNTATLQTYLEQNPVLQILFNGGVIAFRLDGTAIAEVPLSAGRIGVNYMDVDTIAAALKEGKSTIGRPVIGRKLQAPVLGMTVPIRDAQGKLIGALAGVTNLGKSNFLDVVADSRYGKTGGYLLVAPQYRMVVAATDKSRILETLPAPGINPLIDRFIQGYEGSAVVVNPLGVEVLASDKGIPVAGWLVAAALPTAEAFAPIRAMRQRMLIATIFLSLLAGILTWWMLRRQLSPLLAAARTLAALSATNQRPQPLHIARQDEIGQLIGGFNQLLETLGEREALLEQILDTSSVAIFVVDMGGRITQANQRMGEMFGSSLEALEGSEYLALVHPAERECGREKMLALLSGAIPSVDLDRLYWRFDKTEFWGHLTGKFFYDTSGEERGLVGVIADVTERKQAEAALQLSQEKLRELIGHQERIKENERIRIAREIHDELGGLLTGIKANIYVAMDQTERTGVVPIQRMIDAAAQVDAAVDTVRRVITDLRPSVLDQLGVWDALEWYAEQTEAQTGLRCRIVMDELAAATVIDPERSTALFRIVQETLTNVTRHAGASQVEIRVSRENGAIKVEVEDNGKGISAEQLLNRKSWGIAGMVERARYFGGDIRIADTSHGTLVALRLPLDNLNN